MDPSFKGWLIPLGIRYALLWHSKYVLSTFTDLIIYQSAALIAPEYVVLHSYKYNTRVPEVQEHKEPDSWLGMPQNAKHTKAN